MGSKMKIAIIGYSAETGAAKNADEIWQLIIDNQSTIQEIPQFKNRRPFGSYIESAKKFDNDFFGYSYNEALYIDPQHRLLLKHVLKALEMSGEANIKASNNIGVFATCGINVYLLNNILSNINFADLEENPFSMTGNSSDFLATRIAYKMNCQGPAVNVQTGCSGSLVALHLARQSLVANECDVAIVGGVHLTDYDMHGYTHQEGGILSNSGQCNAFDVNAEGTVFSSGVGVVVLKRLEQAEEDNNTIYACIDASFINNDGSRKIGFTAPSVQGQAEVLSRLYIKNGIDIDRISYLETHGTATKLGDAIEIKAINEAFSKFEKYPHNCKIGALKNNIGHTDVAAGMLGIIKLILAFQHSIRPGLLGFKEKNKNLDDSQRSLIFSSEHDEWSGKKVAAISAFGIGGTNAHVVLSEYVDYKLDHSSTSSFPLLLSAKTKKSLDSLAKEFNKHDLRDLSIPLSIAIGRKSFNHRLIQFLDGRISENHIHEVPDIFFMFPGQGCQYVGMAKELYEQLDDYAEEIDVLDLLFQKQGLCSIKELIFSGKYDLSRTLYTQPTLFCIEYALAKCLMKLGIKPSALFGHSLGEYVCYVISGILSLNDAVAILYKRAVLLDGLHDGMMISVNCDIKQIQELIDYNNCDIAAFNAQNLITLSGKRSDIEKIKIELDKLSIFYKDLNTSGAFHSRYIEEIASEFLAFCQDFTFEKGILPIISNITGKEIFEIDAHYLSWHLTSPVNFVEMVHTIRSKSGNAALIEIGPGKTLGTLLKMNNQPEYLKVFQSMRGAHEKEAIDYLPMSLLLCDLWLYGVDVDFSSYAKPWNYRKKALPTYVFDEKDCYLVPKVEQLSKGNKNPINKWLYRKALVSITNNMNLCINDNKERINVKSIQNYSNHQIEHLIIDITGDITVEDYKNTIEFFQKQDFSFKNLKLVDFITHRSCDGYLWSLFKSFALCLPQELSYLNVRFIDSLSNNDLIINKIIDSNLPYRYIKILDGIPYYQTYTDENPQGDQKQYNNVLIIGGAGRMGQFYSHALDRNTSGKIIVGSRSGTFSANDSKFISCPLDITNYNSLSHAFIDIEKKYGTIDLIIHAAGVQQEEHVRRTCDVDSEYIAKVLEPKIKGLQNLKLLSDAIKTKPEVTIVSSISSIIGGIDLLVYTASHSFVDEFATAQGWNVHNWDALRVNEIIEHNVGVTLSNISITDQEGKELSEYLLNKKGNTVISTIDLKTRVDNWSSYQEEQIEENIATNKNTVDRPNLRSVYIPPSTPSEILLHKIWTNFLGYSQIGIDDNFFELGGDSLQALQLVRIISRETGWLIKTVDLFELPNIRALSMKYGDSPSETEENTAQELNARLLNKKKFLENIKNRKKL